MQCARAALRGVALAAALATALAAASTRAAAPASADGDVDRALAAAREKGALVLVDVWAPW